MINDPRSLGDQFNQALAVDETTGAVAIVYHDTAGDPSRRKTHLWYQASNDDGAHRRGGSRPVFPSWTDRRNGGREEIWTAPPVDAGR